MAKAKRVHSTPRRTASKIRTKKRTELRRAVLGAAVDPIFGAIEEYRKLFKACEKLYGALDRAEAKAEKKYGDRPFSLVAWRNYSAIGGSSIDHRREEFLQLPGIDPKKIEKEYLEVKARERAGERAKRIWDKRAGLVALRRENDRAWSALRQAGLRMARTKPRSAAGAAALLAYTKADMSSGETSWHDVALETLIGALASLDHKPHNAVRQSVDHAPDPNVGVIRRNGR
jgi:hypothetical protein